MRTCAHSKLPLEDMEGVQSLKVQKCEDTSQILSIEQSKPSKRVKNSKISNKIKQKCRPVYIPACLLPL